MSKLGQKPFYVKITNTHIVVVVGHDKDQKALNHSYISHGTFRKRLKEFGEQYPNHTKLLIAFFIEGKTFSDKVGKWLRRRVPSTWEAEAFTFPVEYTGNIVLGVCKPLIRIGANDED